MKNLHISNHTICNVFLDF